MYEQVIAGLSRQVEDHSNSLDCLRQSDHNLRLSLRLAEQRALEAEIKLGLAMDRYCVCVRVCMHTILLDPFHCRSQRAEQKCLKLAFKYRGLAKKYRELEKFQQKKAILHQMELATPSPKPSPLPQVSHTYSPLSQLHCSHTHTHSNVLSVDAPRLKEFSLKHSTIETTHQTIHQRKDQVQYKDSIPVNP